MTLVSTISAVIIASFGAGLFLFGARSDFLLQTSLMTPLLPAIVIVATTGSQLRDQEIATNRRLWLWRMLYLGMSTTLATALQCAGGLASQATIDVLAVGRNSLAFIGLGLIGATLIGALAGGLVPFVFVSIPPLYLRDPSEDTTHGVVSFFAQPSTNEVALIFALTALALGIIGASMKDRSRGFLLITMLRFAPR